MPEHFLKYNSLFSAPLLFKSHGPGSPRPNNYCSKGPGNAVNNQRCYVTLLQSTPGVTLQSTPGES